MCLEYEWTVANNYVIRFETRLFQILEVIYQWLDEKIKEGKKNAALQAFYSHYDRLFNFFYPGRKLVSKKREGGKIKRTYDKAQTPYDRALSREDTPDEIKLRLKVLKKR